MMGRCRMPLWLLPAIFLSLALSAATTLNVRDFGAAGNGVQDDYSAIRSAVAALRNHSDGELFFPAGYYRVLSGGNPVMELTGMKRSTIRFAQGAVLVMGENDTHVVSVEGAADHLTFDNVSIQWEKPAKLRAKGDAFHFRETGDAGQITYLQLLNCRVAAVPNRAIYIEGGDGILVRNFTVLDSYGEGVVLDGCENFKLQNLSLSKTAFDAIVLGVQRKAEQISGCRKGELFNIEISGGSGAGLRLSSAVQINVDTLKAKDKNGAAVLLESVADAEVPAGIQLAGIDADTCGAGVEVNSEAQPGALFDFKAVNLKLTNNGNDNIAMTRVAGGAWSRVRSDKGRIRLREFRGTSFQDVRIRDGYVQLFDGGEDSVLGAFNIDRGYFSGERLTGLAIDKMVLRDSPGGAFSLSDSKEMRIDQLQIICPNRREEPDMYAVRVVKCTDLVFQDLKLDLDSRVVTPLDLSGGKLEVIGALKAPGRSYPLDKLLKLPGQLDRDYPTLHIQVAAEIDDQHFTIENSDR